MSNDTAPSNEEAAHTLVREGLKPGARDRTAYRFLLPPAPAASARTLPMRSLSTDLASATWEVIPYFNQGVPDARDSSGTQILDPALNPRAAYRRRIAQLRSFAEEDGIELRIPSESDFLDFACTEPQARPASLVLLDNGNLRAVWRLGQQEVGVQFHGGGSVQYLISREGDDGRVSHAVKRGTLGEFSAAIERAGLGGLLYE